MQIYFPSGSHSTELYAVNFAYLYGDDQYKKHKAKKRLQIDNE
jgi:hypothetical protein